MNVLKNIEVELKFPLLNFAKVVEKLNDVAVLKKEGDFQKDIYYIPEHRNFLAKRPVSEWLRVRESKKGNSVNYKKWHNENGEKTVSCDEYETKVEDLDSFLQILEKLDFKEIVTVAKKRSVWNYNGVEVSIDEVENLGFFMELEAKGDYESIDEAKAFLYKAVSQLGAEVGDQDYEGYPYKLLKQKNLLT